MHFAEKKFVEKSAFQGYSFTSDWCRRFVNGLGLSFVLWGTGRSGRVSQEVWNDGTTNNKQFLHH